MADIQTLKKLLAEEYGITTARELDEAMKKIGRSTTGTHGRSSGISSRKTAGWMLNESGKPARWSVRPQSLRRRPRSRNLL